MKIQKADVHNTERHDTEINNTNWETIVDSEHLNNKNGLEVLEEFISLLNNEDVIVENTWFRIIDDENHVIDC